MKDLFSHLEDSIQSLELLLENGSLNDSKFRKVWNCIQVLKSLEKEAPNRPKINLTRREERILARILNGARVKFKKNRDRRHFESESLLEKGLIFDINPSDQEWMICGITEKGKEHFSG